MNDLGKRLAEARRRAGYTSASAAARSLGMPVPTYAAHENGSRAPERETAQKYAKRFKVTLDWLLNGRPTHFPPTVPLVGYVGEGGLAYFYGNTQVPLDQVSAPEGASEETVAIEVRGDGLGIFLNSWVFFYEHVRRGVPSDLIGQVCVVCLPDERVFVRKIKRSRIKGLFNLYGQYGEPTYDTGVVWAARVIHMAPLAPG
jgi:transcriptional regulator with XRE-family HTH domain